MAEAKPAATKPAPKKFNASSLTEKQLEDCVEHYLGFHPRYFIYEGGFTIKVNVGAIQFDRARGQDIQLEGFKKHLEQIGKKAAV